MSQTSVIPREIGRANRHDIAVEWSDGHRSVYEARPLRLRCPCAMCVDELSGRRTLDPATVPQEVHPLSIELVGRYAVRVYWSDSHSTGIYTFQRLRAMCDCPECAGAPPQEG